MTNSSKKTVIKNFQMHQKDTGSAPVQVALMTKRIESLAEHLEKNPKDNHSRKGLLGIVGNRRKMLQYLKMHQSNKHTEITKDLGLRR